MQTVLVLAHLYCFAICESEDIFVSYRTTIGAHQGEADIKRHTLTKTHKDKPSSLR
jgi:hypothetical protein